MAVLVFFMLLLLMLFPIQPFAYVVSDYIKRAQFRAPLKILSSKLSFGLILKATSNPLSSIAGKKDHCQKKDICSHLMPPYN